MTLLHDIQAALLDDKISVGTTLLKLRFLASKLDADILEEWVQYETEGYPNDVQVPDYRLAQITYNGIFIDSMGRVSSESIPGYLIEKFAGKKWVTYEIREGLPVIDIQLNNISEKSPLGIDSSNLKLLLQDKIYLGMTIVEVRNRIDSGAFTRIQQAVRVKTLDFTLKLEKRVPAAAEISVGQTVGTITSTEQKDVNHLTQQTFYGDVTNIYGDHGAAVKLNIIKGGDMSSLASALEDAGIPIDKAKELAEIAGHEEPQDKDYPLGPNAQKWLENKLKEGAAEAWRLGRSVLQALIIESFKRFYG